MTAQPCFIGHVEALAMAVSFSGEQAFELHLENTQLYAAYNILTLAGQQHQLTHFGMYAIESMRLEKGYGHWKTDFITEFNPMEANLDRFVDLTKEFPGKEGLLNQTKKGNRKMRVLLSIANSEMTAQPGETLFVNNKPVGTITSAPWGYRVNQNLAMAYIKSELALVGAEVEVLLLGNWFKATVTKLCLYDPQHNIPRGIPR